MKWARGKSAAEKIGASLYSPRAAGWRFMWWCKVKGWLNGPKMVILLYLQVNGKCLSVITQEAFQCECLCRRVWQSCEIMGKACPWCFALKVLSPNWKSSSGEFNSVPAGKQYNPRPEEISPYVFLFFFLLFFLFFLLNSVNSEGQRGAIIQDWHIELL